MQEKKEEIVYGIHPVMEAIRSGKTIAKIIVQSGLKGPNIGDLRRLIKTHNIIAQNVPYQKLNKITRKNHQGVIAYISPISYYDIEQLLPFIFEQGKAPCLLMLDRISDVRNFGAICRTAECAGVDGIIIPEKGAAIIHADAMKTSAGALNNIPVCRVKDLENALLYAKNSGLKTIACTEKSDKLLYKADMQVPCLIVMGSEENGISEALLNKCDEKVKIPMIGNTTSLNVSVATAIILYEMIRQRMKVSN